MRPLTLRLTAFGSYAGELEVDFARLGRHGVFSITGPTGSGKSTIFDAIVYALYDDLPGFRTDSHVRSQYADDATPTSVTLTFEADGREWVVERSPAQLRPRRRGDGPPVPDDSRVVLCEVGAAGGGITRKAAVTDAVLRLVGLTKAQFEQVVLIPQGRFEEVLKADTKDRATLLGRLFPVDAYRRTTEALKEAAAAHRAAYESLRAGSDSLIEQIRGDFVVAFGQAPEGVPAPDPDDATLAPGSFDPSTLEERRVQLRQLGAGLAAARDAARSAVDGARGRREAAETLAARWDRWQADLAAVVGFPAEVEADRVAAGDLERARTVARMRPALDQWRAATDALLASSADRTRLLEMVEAAWTGPYDSERLRTAAEAAVLAQTVGADADRQEAADAARTELRQRERALGAEGVRLDELARAAAAADRVLASLEASIGSVRTAHLAVLRDGSGRPEAEARVRELRLAVDAADARVAAESAVASREEALAVALAAEAVTAEATAGVRQAWRDGLAGRLAGHLVDGEPCPTCGSPEHPDPAASTVDAPTDDDLQVAEDALAARIASTQERRVQLAEATAARSALAAAGDPGELRGALTAAEAALDAATAATVEATRLEVELARLEQERDEARDGQSRDRLTLERARATHEADTAQWAREHQAFVGTYGSFDAPDDSAAGLRRLAVAVDGLSQVLRGAETATDRLTQSLGALAPTLAEFGVDDPAALLGWFRDDADVQEAESVLRLRAEARRGVEERIAAYAADDGPAERPDPGPLVDEERAAAARHEDLVGRTAVVTSRTDSVDRAAAGLVDTAGALAVAQVRKEEAETLAAACAGSVAGPVGTRVSLENWVLAYYLRQVLAQANVRLDTMTGGRYALELNREYTDGRKPWGLDLSVLDAETGQSRPATTLSGGETFMAALSLALGLADVVSAGSNYSIGALFVDEGFGSLDGESLDTVIDVLRSLQDGGRMVGVISHVQELQAALPNGITVASTNHGSDADIHYPDA